MRGCIDSRIYVVRDSDDKADYGCYLGKEGLSSARHGLELRDISGSLGFLGTVVGLLIFAANFGWQMTALAFGWRMFVLTTMVATIIQVFQARRATKSATLVLVAILATVHGLSLSRRSSGIRNGKVRNMRNEFSDILVRDFVSAIDYIFVLDCDEVMRNVRSFQTIDEAAKKRKRLGSGVIGVTATYLGSVLDLRLEVVEG